MVQFSLPDDSGLCTWIWGPSPADIKMPSLAIVPCIYLFLKKLTKMRWLWSMLGIRNHCILWLYHHLKVLGKCQLFSRVWFFATPWTVVRQALLSMAFSRQEYWSGLPFPSPGDLPDPGIETQVSCIAGRFFTTRATREAHHHLSLPPAPKIICFLKIKQ